MTHGRHASVPPDPVARFAVALERGQPVDDDTAALLAVVDQLRTAVAADPDAAPRPAFQHALRDQLLALPERDEPAPVVPLRRGAAARPARWRRLPTAVAAAAAVILALTGVALAATGHRNTTLAADPVAAGSAELAAAAGRVDQLVARPADADPTLDDMDRRVKAAARALTADAVAHGDAAALTGLAVWTGRQQTRLEQAAAVVADPDAHRRILQSAHLLGQVHNRALQLAHLVSCNCLDPGRVDDLGVVPVDPCGACSASASASVPAQSDGGMTGQGETTPATTKPEPATAPPAAEPEPTTAPPAAEPTTAPAVTAPVDVPVPTLPVPSPSLPVPTGLVGDILDGLAPDAPTPPGAPEPG